MKCTICHKALYSDLGKGCRMCGMTLIDKSMEYCCKLCRQLYLKNFNFEKKNIYNRLTNMPGDA